MASLDSLPGDQRAVLQLVLGRGRSYVAIANLLSIDVAAVRERASTALDAIGPETEVLEEYRQPIGDYLLGQLGEDEVGPVGDLLARSPAARAWARVLASELAPLAAGPLPEIPAELADPVPPPEESSPPVAAPATEEPSAPAAGPTGAESSPAGERPRSSRRGGAAVLGVAVLIVAAIVIFLVKPGHHPTPSDSVAVNNPTSTSTTATASNTTSAAASPGAPKVLAQINLTPTGGKAAGVADVLQEGSVRVLAIVGQNLVPNTSRNSYEVWLYNSASDAHSLGFVNPGVTSNGRLSTVANRLPSDAGRYRELIVTVETAVAPKTPGPIVLSGPISGLS